jgi:hypothetical protein
MSAIQTIDTEEHEEIIKATLNILATVKARITDDSSTQNTRYNSVAELRFQLDTYTYQVKHGNLDSFEKIAREFAANGPLQQHAVNNGWVNEYSVLAKRFDGLYKEVMK